MASTTSPYEIQCLSSVSAVKDGLAQVGYLSDESIASCVFLADRLHKPVLVEGPAGTGKTQLAKSVAEMTGYRLIRLQCYEGLDESKALYEWDYRKQLLAIQAGHAGLTDEWSSTGRELFSPQFLLERPLLQAIRTRERVVLVVDEVDRIEVETEALLLEVLSDYQVSIPEIGTITASTIPLVFLTSNDTRELSEALRRRCLYLHVDYPDVERELEIVRSKIPEIDEVLASEIVHIVKSLRDLDLEKSPSISETIDWARTLVLLGTEHVTDDVAAATLNVLLKSRSDIDLAIGILGRGLRG